MNNWIERIQQDDEGRRILEQERVILEITEAIAVLMEKEEISRSELARRIGKSPAFVTKILRGTNNFTLRTISDLFFALGRSAHISIAPLGDRIQVAQTTNPAPLRITAWGQTPLKQPVRWKKINLEGEEKEQGLAA